MEGKNLLTVEHISKSFGGLKENYQYYRAERCGKDDSI